jgi:hypothetical protein
LAEFLCWCCLTIPGDSTFWTYLHKVLGKTLCSISKLAEHDVTGTDIVVMRVCDNQYVRVSMRKAVDCELFHLFVLLYDSPLYFSNTVSLPSQKQSRPLPTRVVPSHPTIRTDGMTTQLSTPLPWINFFWLSCFFSLDARIHALSHDC